jgi:hypothetical protein
MNITELEKLAKAAIPDYMHHVHIHRFHEAATPEAVLQLIELLREMGEALENCVDYFDGCIVNGKDTEPEAAIEAAESARKQFAKFKEMTK